MSFHVSAWSIKNPVPTIVLFLILGIVGLMSFFSLGIDDNPNIDIPIVQVQVTQPGAGPTELETQITKKVEDAVASLGNIDAINSTVTDGNSTTTIEFELGTDSDRATNDVRNAVAQIRQDLPQDANEPIVQRLEFAGGAIMTYVVASEQRSVEQLSNLVDQTISRELLNVSGVAQINRLGGVDREIRIDLDAERLQAYGITATQVNDQVGALNINLPGGRAEVGGGEQNIRTLGSARTVEELKSYRVVLPGGATVPLTDLGTVEDSYAEPRNAAFFNNQPVVAFSVLRSTGSTLVTVEEGVRKQVEKLRTTLPEDIELELIFTRANSIRDSFRATIDSLVIACILTTIAVGLFLRDWRATLITSMALPLSIIPTFIVMQSLDYTLNEMTLLALALAIGNLVDDAICMIENIDQHIEMGKKPYKAALDAAREIGLAVVATTATIVAVFLPVAFMGGIPGQFFQPFGVTVAVSTMFSTLVACTMTPMLSAYLLKPKTSKLGQGKKSGTTSSQLLARFWRLGGAKKHDPANSQTAVTNSPASKRIQPYRGMLTWALRHRITTLLLAIAFFIASLQLVPYIPKGLFDSGDTGLSLVSIDLPPGSTLSETEQVIKQTTDLLQENPAVESVFASAEKIDTATVYANLVPKAERSLSQQEFEQQMREDFRRIPGARVSFRSQGAGGGGKDLSIVLKSDNPEALQQAAEALETQMSRIPGLVEITSSASLVKPEIVIVPDRDRAADLGVSVRNIARTASLALIGDNESNLAKFNLPDRQIPIRVQLNPEQRSDLDTLRNLRVPSQDGSLVPLTAVADIRLASGSAQIDRFDRRRQVSVEANLEGISLGDALEQVRALPAMNPLPPEVTEEPAGDAEIMRDIFSRFVTALGLAVLSIYAILVLLYNNFLYPLGILVALPLSLGGALLGLLITQKELGLFALIGIVLLMGLVTKNAILLVDFALENERRGLPQFRAVVEAGVSRLRPILMTSISTIAGMLPIALEYGAGGEVRSPMAIAVIGGFSTSTLLTLVVVPVIFTYVDNTIHWFSKMFNRSEDDIEDPGAIEPKNVN
ncbi:MAG: efflux RND transporter permease subunit [Oscillatoria sp. PMC 1051.18]|nr:efflux RND transporter permease subunit [Oscillatoria sp. PMC 1050.18]MEC5028980.1 efflux RND transporter permease subunit [Oscillatoria sp. PMC 1051.18]